MDEVLLARGEGEADEAPVTLLRLFQIGKVHLVVRDLDALVGPVAVPLGDQGRTVGRSRGGEDASGERLLLLEELLDLLLSEFDLIGTDVGNDLVLIVEGPDAPN